ncbi:MAG: recombinase family protein [Gemmatimonadetes bacterium]|nr:recombinase family protein [Gemmatimonadota bacterium]
MNVALASAKPLKRLMPRRQIPWGFSEHRQIPGRKADRRLPSTIRAAAARRCCEPATIENIKQASVFIANLMEAGVDFVACDLPDANRLTLHIMAAMAEHEREAISKRTREA